MSGWLHDGGTSEYGSGEWFRLNVQPTIRSMVRAEIVRALEIVSQEFDRQSDYYPSNSNMIRAMEAARDATLRAVGKIGEGE